MSRVLRARIWTFAAVAACSAGLAVAACGLEEGGFGGAGTNDSGVDAFVPNVDGGVDGCAPVERCNGVDDNCNGAVDEGCPVCTDAGECPGLLELSGFTEGKEIGYKGQLGPTWYRDECDGGLVGIAGNAPRSILYNMQTRCVGLALHREKSGSDYTYRVHWSGEPYTKGGSHGPPSTSAGYDASCAAPKVVTGIRIVSNDIPGIDGGDGITKLEFDCKELVLEGNPGAFRLALAAGDAVRVDTGASGSGTRLEESDTPLPPVIFGGLSCTSRENEERDIERLKMLHRTPSLKPFSE